MRRITLLVVCSGLTLAGCNATIHGTWKTAGVTPEGAEKNFKIATATFNPNSTFVVVSQYGKEKKTSKGVYSFDGFRLNLVGTDGTERSYDCMKVWDKLEITREHEGQKIKVVMAKE